MALTVNTNMKNDADGYLTDAKFIKGTYVVVNTTDERDNLYSSTAIPGTLCHVTENNKTYRKTADGWAEENKVDRADIENVIYYEDGEEPDVDEVVLMSEFEAANNELKESIAEKLTEPTSGIKVGKYFRVASIDENGHAVLEYVDVPVTAENIEIALGYTPADNETVTQL